MVFTHKYSGRELKLCSILAPKTWDALCKKKVGTVSVCSKGSGKMKRTEFPCLNNTKFTTVYAASASVPCTATKKTVSMITGVFKKRKHPGKRSSVDYLYPVDKRRRLLLIG